MGDLEPRIDACAEMLLATARENGMTISGDRRVSEQDAAMLLGYSAGYMKQMRYEGKGPQAYGAGMNGSRVSYRLDAIAAWIELARLE